MFPLTLTVLHKVLIGALESPLRTASISGGNIPSLGFIETLHPQPQILLHTKPILNLEPWPKTHV